MTIVRPVSGMLRRGLALSLVGSLLMTSACKDANKDADSDAKAAAPRVGPVGEADMKGLVKVRDEFLAVKDVEALEAFLNKLQAGYASATPEVKAFTSFAMLLRPARSIIYRVTPLFTATKGTHSAVLTLVQQAASTVATYLPTPQWAAMVAYVSEPDESTTQFRTVAELQTEAEAVIIPLLAKTIKDVTAIEVTDASPIVWDNRFAYGTASFKDPRDRFIKFGVAEKWASIAGLNNALSATRAMCAYNLNDLLKVSESMGKLMGLDGFLFSSIDGMPLSARVKALAPFTTFLTLRSGSSTGNGKALMADALTSVRASVDAASKSYAAVVARNTALAGKVDEFWSIRPDIVMIAQRGIELSLKDAQAIAAGPAQIISNVTGETTAVNAPAFFTNPPADLKVFLPVAFVEDAEKAVAGNEIRNYLYGSPTAWKASAYAPYLPGVKSAADVKDVARILAQSWGGGGIAAAMAGFVN